MKLVLGRTYRISAIDHHSITVDQTHDEDVDSRIEFTGTYTGRLRQKGRRFVLLTSIFYFDGSGLLVPRETTKVIESAITEIVPLRPPRRRRAK